jgi:hypothetical protein
VATVAVTRRHDLTDTVGGAGPAVACAVVDGSAAEAGEKAQGDAQGRIDGTVGVDSMAGRAHQHAAGARRDGHLQKEPPGGVQVHPGPGAASG